ASKRLATALSRCSFASDFDWAAAPLMAPMIATMIPPIAVIRAGIAAISAITLAGAHSLEPDVAPGAGVCAYAGRALLYSMPHRSSVLQVRRNMRVFSPSRAGT